jgi:hypothetical protein
MRKQKYLFNNLLRRYNKIVRKVTRLKDEGKNLRKQSILLKQIERLKDNLLSLQLYIKRGTVIAGIAIAVTSINLNAQNFEAPVTNPFGLVFSGNELSSTSFADLDGDGDLDLLSGEYNDPAGSIHYFQNIGTNTNPDFDAGISNPFGINIQSAVTRPHFEDIDGDGDYDILCGTNDGAFVYFENSGTISSPQFEAGVTNPFGLTSLGYNSSPTTVDIDNDGDFDIIAGGFDYYNAEYYYFENTGTAIAPSFGGVQTNPYGLTDASLLASCDFADLDFDGDLDMLVGGYFSDYGDFAYYENIGTVSNPSFGARQINPFNIEQTGQYWNTVAFADIDNDGLDEFISGSYGGDFFYYDNSCDVTASSFPACNGTDGSIETIAAMPGTLTYEWDNGATTQNLSNLSTGDYNLTVTSSIGCIETTSVTVNPVNSTPLNTSVNILSEISCSGESDGAAEVLSDGGNAPHTYVWDTNYGQDWNLLAAAGIYTVTVTEACGNSEIESITLTEPTLVIVNITTTDETVLFNFDGTSTAVVAGGITPYSYDWNNGTQIATSTGIGTGTVTVEVIDGNGCRVLENGFVNLSGCAMSVSTSITSPDNCNDSNGEAIGEASGGSTPYSYEWPGAGYSGNLAFGMRQNEEYSVITTDANGCKAVQYFTMTGATGFDYVQITSVAPTCGNSDGSASLNIQGGATPYTYIWYDATSQTAISTANNIPNIGASALAIEVTDAYGCVEVSLVLLSNEEAPSVNVNTTDESCFGTSDGSIELTVSGGSSPYTYDWYDISEGTSASGDTYLDNLSKDAQYIVEISDVSSPSCKALVLANVYGPDEIFIFQNNIVDPLCFNDDNGLLSVGAAYAYFPITYEWSNGMTSEQITGLASGIYTVTVIDDNGCTKNKEYTLEEPNIVTVTINANDATCGNADGSTSFIDGNNIQSLEWSTGDNSFNVSNLMSGIYTVTATDGNGCESESNSVVVNNSNGPSFTITSTDVTCFGNDGTIMLTPAGAYTYLWSDGSTTQDLSNIDAGDFLVTASSGGCDAFGIAIVNSPGDLSYTISKSNVSCFAAADASIDIDGSSAYTYMWSNGASTEAIVNLSGNTYNVTISEGACTSEESLTITEPNAFAYTIDSQDVTCAGDNDGIASVVTSESYSYNWSTSNTTQNVTELEGNIYSVTVTDNTCIEINSITINESSVISITTSSTDETSLGLNDGTVSASGTGGTGTLSFDWGVAGTGASLSGLAPGSYGVEVTDQNGCSETQSVTVTEATSTGVNNISTSNIVKIYPNPNNGKFVINMNTNDLYYVSITNIVGQNVVSTTFTGITKEIQLNEVESGMYFVTVKNESFMFTERVIVK